LRIAVTPAFTFLRYDDSDGSPRAALQVGAREYAAVEKGASLDDLAFVAKLFSVVLTVHALQHPRSAPWWTKRPSARAGRCTPSGRWR